MLFEKCKWRNDAQAPAILMIDDLVPAAISPDGNLYAGNDWGYLMNAENSLYTFFADNFQANHPEARGTVFLPLEEHKNITSNGYYVQTRDFDDEYVKFLKSLETTFEFAFHGIRHAWEEDGQIFFEFENFEDSSFKAYSRKIHEFEDQTKINFNGVKFPGYKNNNASMRFIYEHGFRWVALSAIMAHKKGKSNGLSYKFDLIDVPTNITGDAAAQKKQKVGLKKRIKKVIHKRFNFENYLLYLYQNGHPITIQEHFQNQRTDGKRQKPNVFDDIDSLNRIYSFLKPLKIWHTNCTKLSHYFDSYMNTHIIVQDNEILINYKGKWNKSYLSYKSSNETIINLATGDEILGVKNDNEWIFNDLENGRYKI